VYGHCLAASNLPRLTVTTSRDQHGRTVWYLGGQVAEAGVPRSPQEQIIAAKKELDACLPWLHIGARPDVQWSTVRWDRAEGFMPDGTRPDEPVLLGDPAAPGVLFGWPTKLAFAPRMAEMVIAEAVKTGIKPHPDIGAAISIPPATPAKVALAAWDEPTAAWT
jgi:hypothetical protein